MSNQTLEQRVTALERRLAELEAAEMNGLREKNWERTFGMFTGDEVSKRVDAEILNARELERKKARSRGTRRNKPAARRART